MAASYEKKLGLTGPLSQALPTEAEKSQSDALIEELRRQNNYESPADTKKRYVVFSTYHFHSWSTNTSALREIANLPSPFADTTSLIPYKRLQKNLLDELADLRGFLNR